MKILFEPQIFNSQKYGGISRYYSEIYKGLVNFQDADVELPLLLSDNYHIKDVIENQKKELVIVKVLSYFHFFKKKFARKKVRKNNKLVNETLKKNNYDLLIPTYYNPFFLELNNGKPFVLTVYDMIHEIFPDYFDKNDKTSEWKKTLIPKASRIIAVSNNTKKDILKFFPTINPEKIDVVYHGHSSNLNKKNVDCLPNNYILFVGNRQHYKNSNFYINAIHTILLENENLIGFFAGGNPFNKEEIELLTNLGIQNKVIQYNFEDSELDTIYENAKCFIFPSQYEGFGIPVLESMANNCPIILPYHSSFPEVAGEAGIFYNVNDGKDLTRKINQVLIDNTFRQKHIDLGKLQVAKFTWEKATKECFEVYKKAIN